MERTQEAAESVKYVLNPLQPSQFKYQAGQFLTFLFRHTGKELRRSYSLCTSPHTDSDPAILVKKVYNGEISRYMHDTWRIGDLVEALPPAGRFMLEEKTDHGRDIFLLAAGSGISPLLGILKEALWLEPYSFLHLFYSNRNEEETIFYKDLVELQARFQDRMEVDYFFSESKDLNNARLHRWKLEELVSKRLRLARENAVFFVCGPNEYMQMVEIVLISMGIERNNIRKEVFLVEKPARPLFELTDKTPRTVHVTLYGQRHSLVVPPSQSILEAALAKGLPAPFNCQAGKCSACLAKCTYGKVVMSYNEVLTELDEQRGLVLTCTGHPLTEGVEIAY